ncbi:hypothetical protein INT47_009233 [Mucor saturninus]|uniref:Uncharacterized protein n=1 Tax=Mucor saturninus TaxID=64648 RepID=A0A8H7QIP9_9FUNG|nr:hypothetical protein INT47_009233 [Mucor saturninus]
MTNTKSLLKPRGQAIATPSKGKDSLRPVSNGSGFKSSVADPKADLLRKQQLAHATVRQLVPSPEASSVTLLATTTMPTRTNTRSMASQDSEIANGQEIPSSFDSSSLPSVPPSLIGDTQMFSSLPEFALDMQKQLREQNRRFDEYEARFTAMEAILQENASLKASALVMETKLRDQSDLIADLQHQLASAGNSSVSMDTEPTRDLSSNASKWSQVPYSQHTRPTAKASAKPTASPSKPGLTMAQKVALNASKPVKPKPKPKQLTAEAIANIARPFLERDVNEPSGFQYVYIGRSRKITRAETRKRFKLVGVDTSRIIDITFPATGVLGVLVHELYAPVFTSIMTSIKAGIIKDFDPLDPKHLANPVYSSYSEEARADIAAVLHSNRCKHALLYLHNTRPHQVRSVGHSLINFGYISEEDLQAIIATPPQDPRSQINEAAAKLFNAPPGRGPSPSASQHTDSMEDVEADMFGTAPVDMFEEVKLVSEDEV